MMVKEAKRSQTRRSILVLALAVGIVLIIAGISQAKTELTFWRWVDAMQNPPLEKLINQWNKENPDIQVHLEIFPGGSAEYNAKLNLAFASGNPPNIFPLQDNSWHRFAKMGYLSPAPSYVAEWIKKNIAIEGMLAGLMDEGKVYGVPGAGTFERLYYNKEMFDEAGIEYANENWTWKEYIAAAKKLTEYDAQGKVAVAGISLRKTGHEEGIYSKFTSFLYSSSESGGDIPNLVSEDLKKIVLIENPAAGEAIQLYYDILFTWKLDSVDIQGDAAGFANRRCAMFNRGLWVPGFMITNAPDLKYGSTNIAKNKRSATIGSISPMLVTEATEDKEAAWKFIKWISDDPQYLQWAIEGKQYPMTQNVAMNPRWSEDPIYRTFLKQPYVQMTPELGPTYEIRSIVGKYIEQVCYGKLLPNQALLEAQKEAQKVLDDWWKTR